MPETEAPPPQPERPQAPPPTPFDHPLFLPAILAGLALWFGYDGWFNPEIKAVNFNRYGFGVLLLGALWFGYKGLKEMREPPDPGGVELGNESCHEGHVLPDQRELAEEDDVVIGELRDDVCVGR